MSIDSTSGKECFLSKNLVSLDNSIYSLTGSAPGREDSHPTSIKSAYLYSKSFNLLNNDKKVKDGLVSYVLLESIENPILEKVEIKKVLEMILDE